MTPRIHIFAGPNGAGKTTFAREFLPREGLSGVHQRRLDHKDASNILLRTLGKFVVLRIIPKIPWGLPTSAAMRQTGVPADPAEFEGD